MRRRSYKHAPYDWIFVPDGGAQVEDKSGTAQDYFNPNGSFVSQLRWRDIATRQFEWLLLFGVEDPPEVTPVTQDKLLCWLLPKNIARSILNKSAGGSIVYTLKNEGYFAVNHRWKARLLDCGRLTYAQLYQECEKGTLEHFRAARYPRTETIGASYARQ